MKKGKSAVSVFMVVLVCALLGPALRGDSAAAVTPDGPMPVGVRLLYFQYQDRQMPVMIWYPAKPAAGAQRYDYRGTKRHTVAVLDAPIEPSGAPYPLLLFSHGMGGCASQSVFYTENLASAGYVVVAPEHADAAMCRVDRDPDITIGQILKAALKSGGNLSGAVMTLFGERFRKTNYDLSYRPLEAKAAIDQALAWNQDPASFMNGLVDPSRIGATGHSLGGYTTLSIGGVPFLCDQPEDRDPQNCDFNNATLDKIPNPCCLAYVRDGDPYQFRDPRVKAILPLGPAVFYPHLDRAAAQLTLPVMIITGDNKRMEVPWAPIWTFYQNAKPPKYLVRLKATDHLTISDTALDISGANLVLPGFRSHFEEKAEAYKDYSVAFFNLYLKAQGSAADLKAIQNNFAEFWGEP